LFTAATDLTWPEVVIARGAIRIKAAIVRLFIVMVTLSGNLLAAISLGHTASATLW
jgi:hypothetical protein